ncbi:MAG: glycosyltransferase family 2 protein [Bacteroidales bacterium]
MWYSKYLSIYEHPYNLVPKELILEIAHKVNLIQSVNPIVSVVIIAYNEETHLAACIWSLSDNRCKYPIEIIGIDNNSTDRTAEIYKALGVKYFLEQKKGHGNARNCGLDNAKGKYYVCIDADTIYPPKYIETLIEQLKKPNVSGVYSLWNYIKDNEHSTIGIKLYEFLRNLNLRIKSIKRPESSVRGMVFAIKMNFAKEIRFRTDIKRGEDGSMAYALKRYGKLKFITSKSARAATSLRSIINDGSLFNALKIRAIKHFKGLKYYFTSKKATECRDDDSNLIK